MSKEVTFGINNFNKPAEYSGADADTIRLYYIIMGRYDRLGFQISRYRFKQIANSISEIENKLKEHISKVCPDIYIESIDITQTSSKSLRLTISIFKSTTEERKMIFFGITEDKSRTIVSILKNK